MPQEDHADHRLSRRICSRTNPRKGTLPIAFDQTDRYAYPRLAV